MNTFVSSKLVPVPLASTKRVAGAKVRLRTTENRLAATSLEPKNGARNLPD